MVKKVIGFFKSGPDLPQIEDEGTVRRIYERKRWSVLLTLIFGYGFYYTCRLSLSVAKKPMLDADVMSVEQMGLIGSMLFYVYAVGKCFNGFLADRANIRRFMSAALMASAITNLLFGSTTVFYGFLILWALNGWFQSIGSAPSVVSLCQWFSQKERGSRYGIWAGAHNIGEGLTFVGTSVIVGAFGWRWGFWGPGIACVIVAAVMFRTLADRPQTYGLPHVSDYKRDYTGGKPSTESIGREQLRVLKHPLVICLGISSALMYVARYGIHSWGILYLQEAKSYSLEQAGALIGFNTIIGLAGAASSGLISDFFFGSRRNVPCLIYGCLLIAGLVMLHQTPPGHFWLDALAIGIFEFAIGGLIVFLAGLIAVDVMPKKAAGAVKGVIGLFSYTAAATQEWISGLLIENTKTVIDGHAHYEFDTAFYFWIGASVLSLLFALPAWNVKPHE